MKGPCELNWTNTRRNSFFPSLPGFKRSPWGEKKVCSIYISSRQPNNIYRLGSIWKKMNWSQLEEKQKVIEAIWEEVECLVVLPRTGRVRLEALFHKQKRKQISIQILKNINVERKSHSGCAGYKTGAKMFQRSHATPFLRSWFWKNNNKIR